MPAWTRSELVMAAVSVMHELPEKKECRVLMHCMLQQQTIQHHAGGPIWS